jgi:hypothetical protein
VYLNPIQIGMLTCGGLKEIRYGRANGAKRPDIGTSSVDARNPLWSGHHFGLCKISVEFMPV